MIFRPTNQGDKGREEMMQGHEHMKHKKGPPVPRQGGKFPWGRTVRQR
jgi:hypothetical protein